jgi:cephalosporin hydroxylase
VSRTIIDTDSNEVLFVEGDETKRFDLSTSEAFDLVAKAYLRAGWDSKYVYSFTWMGRPIIQLPDDMVRAQELIYAVKPDVLVEVGVAHGGSLIFYASLMQAMGKGRVVGVDIEIRPHNRRAIESHEMSGRISLIEGNSVEEGTVEAVRALIKEGDIVMVFLDGKHTYGHVLRELELYAPMVTKGSYILAMDGIQQDLVGAPRSQSDWSHNNSAAAAESFVKENPQFVIKEPGPRFNEGKITKFVTYWPGAYLLRVR